MARSGRGLLQPASDSTSQVAWTEPGVSHSRRDFIWAASVLRCRAISGWQGLSGDREAYDAARESVISQMEKTLRKTKLPSTDSIEELARFWDTHDLTDFEDELEEVTESIFVRQKRSFPILLPDEAIRNLERIAKTEGVAETTVLRRWVMEKLHKGAGTSRQSTTSRARRTKNGERAT